MGYTKLSEEEMHDRVCEVAKKSFAEKGILGTEMKYIAEQVGVGRATLYRNYPGLRYIAYIVAADYMNEVTEKFKEVDTSCLDGYSALLKIRLKGVEYFVANHDVMRFYNEFDTIFPPPYDCSKEAEIYVDSMKRNFSIKKALLDRGIEDGSIRNDKDTMEKYMTAEQAITGYIQRIEILHHEKNKEARLKWLINTLMESIKNN